MKVLASMLLALSALAAGQWRLLSGGDAPRIWRSFKGESFPPAGWALERGVLRRVPGVKDVPDLISRDQFESFELTLEWKMGWGANSGIKYFVDESFVKESDARSGVGFELQLAAPPDPSGKPKQPASDQPTGLSRPERTQPKRDPNLHALGAVYDLVPPSRPATFRGPDRWNTVRLVVRGDHVEHWINGVKILEFDRGDADFKQRIAQSKFKDTPGFGANRRGHILLQNHGDEVQFRNIRIRVLPPPAETAR